MPDEQIPDSPDEFAEVRAALADLDFLRPDGLDPASPAMPEDVWARLDHALALEAATRAAETHDNVVVLSRPRRRWAGGVVAAAVTVVAVGAGVVVVQGAATQSIVATESAKRVATAQAPAAMAEAPAEGGAESGAEDMAVAAPAPGSVVPASRIVMASNTQYTPSGLRSQVTTMVKERFATQEDALGDEAVPVQMPVVGGFTQSWESLRACLEQLTNSPTIQALVVDRGTFNGTAAGVIVAPVEQAAGLFDVWVVNEDCQQLMDPLDDFALYEWTP